MLEAECMLLNRVSSSQEKDEKSKVLRMTRDSQKCDYENACLRRIRNVAQQKGKIVFDKPHWYFFSAKAATNKK